MIVNNNFRENGNTLAFLKNSVMMRLSYAVVAIHELNCLLIQKHCSS